MQMGLVTHVGEVTAALVVRQPYVVAFRPSASFYPQAPYRPVAQSYIPHQAASLVINGGN